MLKVLVEIAFSWRARKFIGIGRRKLQVGVTFFNIVIPVELQHSSLSAIQFLREVLMIGDHCLWDVWRTEQVFSRTLLLRKQSSFAHGHNCLGIIDWTTALKNLPVSYVVSVASTGRR
jgi:hypothetical protein